MKIYVSHSTKFDYNRELYQPLRASELNKKHEIVLPHEGGKNINSKEVIKNSDLVLAEVSLPAMGQGIELGWADAFDRPIICLYQSDKEFSPYLKYLTEKFISYRDSLDLIQQLEKLLTE